MARTCTYFWGVLVQHIPVPAQHIPVPIVGLHPRIEADTDPLRDYNQPTSQAERMPSLRLPCPTPSVTNAVVNLILARVLLKAPMRVAKPIWQSIDLTQYFPIAVPAHPMVTVLSFATSTLCALGNSLSPRSASIVPAQWKECNQQASRQSHKQGD